ncbi:MAG: NADH-quinone oxidoreductase subunit A [Elusimicrobia bacterium]|nr:NADH-quinone oxidoreductase subunit A [Elusimicrobiota bacterium]
MSLALAFDVLIVGGLAAAFASASVVFGRRRSLQGEKSMPYETGLRPLAPAAPAMTVAYHRFAVLFVIFDIDLALLLPWVLMRDRLTLGAMAAITVFLGLVALTLAYVWRKGALEA